MEATFQTHEDGPNREHHGCPDGSLTTMIGSTGSSWSSSSSSWSYYSVHGLQRLNAESYQHEEKSKDKSSNDKLNEENEEDEKSKSSSWSSWYKSGAESRIDDLVYRIGDLVQMDLAPSKLKSLAREALEIALCLKWDIYPRPHYKSVAVSCVWYAVLKSGLLSTTHSAKEVTTWAVDPNSYASSRGMIRRVGVVDSSSVSLAPQVQSTLELILDASGVDRSLLSSSSSSSFMPLDVGVGVGVGVWSPSSSPTPTPMSLSSSSVANVGDADFLLSELHVLDPRSACSLDSVFESCVDYDISFADEVLELTGEALLSVVNDVCTDPLSEALLEVKVVDKSKARVVMESLRPSLVHDDEDGLTTIYTFAKAFSLLEGRDDLELQPECILSILSLVEKMKATREVLAHVSEEELVMLKAKLNERYEKHCAAEQIARRASKRKSVVSRSRLYTSGVVAEASSSTKKLRLE